MTTDHHLVSKVCTLLENRRFYVELGGKRSRRRLHENGLRVGSCLYRYSSMYTQTISPSIRTHAASCMQTISPPLPKIHNVVSTCVRLTEYCETNQLRANPTKPQVSFSIYTTANTPDRR